MKGYERRLPHWDAVGQPCFITFCLRNSPPANRVFPPARMTNGRAFVAMDRLLDRPRCGSIFLKEPGIAEMVVQSIQDGERRFGRYELHSFVVMPNHVHLLLTPRVMLAECLRSLKGYTASKANKLLGRHGAFWQDESYDHLVRDSEQFARIRRYIEWNPVKAELVTAPEEFEWSSAAPGRSPAAGSKA